MVATAQVFRWGNQTATLADWNAELLPIELSGLQAMQFDLGLLRFDPEEPQQFMSGGVNQSLSDPDDVPLPPDEATRQSAN